jgi:small-conductance mechanosensitive channel
MIDEFSDMDSPSRILLAIACVAAAHVAVIVIRKASKQALAASFTPRLTRSRAIVTLLTSALVFSLYFGAVGFVLTEAGVPITTYLASASIIALAVAFGSQGLVQDVVTGLTVVFSRLFDVGDMVEIGGQTGIVQRLGMRFTVMINSMGAEVYIPNRSIGNVVRYPRGYVRCLADITLSTDPETAAKMEDALRPLVASAWEQFPAILRTPPDYEGIQGTSSGRKFLRVKFRIWPGRGGPIETQFRQEALQVLKSIDPAYADWMIAVTYEVESKAVPAGRA